MKHKGTVLIKTNRLILRKFRLDDSKPAFKNWTSDDKVTEFLRWPTHREWRLQNQSLECGLWLCKG